MAVTINSEATSPHTPYRPLEFDVTSDDPTIVRMKADLKSSPALTLIGTIVKDPRLTTSDNFIFDFESLLRRQVSFDLQPAITDLVDGVNTIFDYRVDFTELVLSGSNTLIDGAGINSSVRQILNATLQHEEVQNFTAFDMDGPTKKFLSKGPTTRSIGENQDETAGCFRDGMLIALWRLSIERFDLSGVSLGVFLKPLVAPTVNRFDVPVGTKNLSGDVSFVGVSRYTVHVERAGAQVSEKRTYVIDRGCADQIVRIHFLNELGAFEAYNFLDPTRSYDFSSEVIKSVLPTNFTKSDRGLKKISVDSNNTFNVISRSETSEALIWLEELAGSLEQYLENSDNDIIPIIILDGGINTDSEGVAPIQNFELDFILSNERIKQIN